MLCDSKGELMRGTKGFGIVIDIYRGERYNVIADMASGYLRVQDIATKKHLKFDGTFTKEKEGTHFKIKRREEM